MVEKGRVTYRSLRRYIITILFMTAAIPLILIAQRKGEQTKTIYK